MALMSESPVTLITGSRKGIGRHLAEHFLKKGHVVIGCSRGPSDLKAERYVHHQLDVCSEKDVVLFFKTLAKDYPRLDHLINNAGIASMNHSMLTPVSTVTQVLNTNVVGTFLFCREAARVMQRRKFGRIVNFGSIATPLKLEGEAIYAASKAAVVSLTEVLARELAPLGITVNVVGPMPVETDLVKSVPKEKMDRLLSRLAIPRMGTFADVSNVVDFYLRPESSYVTGQCLYLGGV